MSDRRPARSRRRSRLLILLAALLLVAIPVGAVLVGPPTDGASSPAGRFPPGGTGSTATLWAVGDAAAPTAAARRVARLVMSEPPDRFLYLGDVYEDGSRQSFDRYYEPLYGALRRRTLPTPGNHDWPNRGQGYDSFWSGVTSGPVPHHYSVRLAGWQLISLNSEDDLGADSEQVRWLEHTVAGSGNCRLAFWHAPRFSAGKHGDADEVAPLWNALRGRAALVLNGHDHDMQRLRARDGIVELVAGGGGKSLYPLDRTDIPGSPGGTASATEPCGCACARVERNGPSTQPTVVDYSTRD